MKVDNAGLAIYQSVAMVRSRKNIFLYEFIMLICCAQLAFTSSFVLLVVTTRGVTVTFFIGTDIDMWQYVCTYPCFSRCPKRTNAQFLSSPSGRQHHSLPPLKNHSFCFPHVSFVHPGHLSIICVLAGVLFPLETSLICSAAMSANARANVGEPLRDSERVRFIPS